MRNTTENQIELTLIRHGKTKGNLEHRYIGSTDEELTKEAEIELKKIEAPFADFVCVSPMRRCMQTARILYPEEEIFIIEEFQEMDFGQFEGLNYQDLKDNSTYQEFIDSNGEKPFPGGETKENFVKRSLQGLSKLRKVVEEKYPKDQLVKISAIVHGGTIMALASSILGGDYYDYQIGNNQSITLVINRSEE